MSTPRGFREYDCVVAGSINLDLLHDLWRHKLVKKASTGAYTDVKQVRSLVRHLSEMADIRHPTVTARRSRNAQARRGRSIGFERYDCNAEIVTHEMAHIALQQWGEHANHRTPRFVQVLDRMALEAEDWIHLSR